MYIYSIFFDAPFVVWRSKTFFKFDRTEEEFWTDAGFERVEICIWKFDSVGIMNWSLLLTGHNVDNFTFRQYICYFSCFYWRS